VEIAGAVSLTVGGFRMILRRYFYFHRRALTIGFDPRWITSKGMYMASALPATPLQNQIDRIKTRRLGSSAPFVRDTRRAQSAPKTVEPTKEQVSAVQKTLGIDPSKPTAKKEILVHSCFDQRHSQTKPKDCRCDVYIEYWRCRDLINKGDADFLTYRRAGREHQNRKSIVLTADFLQRQAKSQDALNHKQPLSLTAFIDSSSGYHMAPVSDEATSGLDKKINNVRRATIHERKTEVESRRKHHVGAANFRKGAGGLTVGVGGGKIVDLTKAGAAVKKGNAPDSDSSHDDVLCGNATGQINSKADPNYSRGLEPYDNPNRNPKAIPGTKAAKLESARNLPKPIDKVVGIQEAKEFQKESSKNQTAIMTGVE
jgi:hypothetical protein